MENIKIGTKVRLLSLDIVDEIFTDLKIGDIGEVIHFNNVLGQYTVNFDGELGQMRIEQLEVISDNNDPKHLNIGDSDSANKIKFIEGELIENYIIIGDLTICIPKGSSYGISQKHPNDEYCELTGKAVSFMRMMEKAKELEMM